MTRVSSFALSCALVLAFTGAARADGDPDLDTSTLDADEAAGAMPEDPVVWTADAARVACPESATNDDGRCTPAGDLAPASAGCASTTPGVLLVLLVVGFALRRRKRAVLALAIAAACATDAGSWDDAVDDDAPASGRIDVYSADLGDGDGAQLLLAHQDLIPGAQQPVAAFALASARGDVPIRRSATACGDRLSTTQGDELLGWAAADAGDGTAELVELAAPDGCAHVYETAPDTVDALVADGYAITAHLGHVWPPALASDLDPAPLDGVALAPACAPTTAGPWFLLYASPGADEGETFLAGCHGEVIIGEKHDAGPTGRMRLAANHAKGGRTAFVLDRNGDMLREMLARPNGVDRTAADLKAKLAAGYDYVVVDEITAAPDWADGGSLNVKFRKLLLELPPRKVIGYVSIDLTQYADGAAKMRDRRLLLRALKQRGRGIAMEIYLHTRSVMAGAAPSTYRVAADRLARAVAGLAHGGGINLRAISVVGTSMHSAYPQYRYLDQGAHDLASITKQVNAIRHASKRTRQQKGVGYYFVNKSDMAPPSAYSYDALIARMRAQLGRF